MAVQPKESDLERGPETETEPFLGDESSAAANIDAAEPGPPAYEREHDCPHCKKRVLTNGDYVTAPLIKTKWWKAFLAKVCGFVALVLFFGFWWDGMHLFVARLLGQMEWNSYMMKTKSA